MKAAAIVAVLAVTAAGLAARAADAPVVRVDAARIEVATDGAPVYPIAGGKGEAVLLHNLDTGSKEAALSVITLAPGAEVPQHVHETSAEFLYVEQGSAELTVGGKPVILKPGMAVRIPAGVPHSAKVASAVHSFRAVQFSVGPGPEQRFKGAPAK